MEAFTTKQYFVFMHLRLLFSLQLEQFVSIKKKNTRFLTSIESSISR